MNQDDRAGEAYWDNNWSDAELPKLFSDSNDALDNFVNLQLHEYFCTLFKTKKEFKILEIGCANSVWPIYFNQYFSALADGLDYSEVGCKKSRDLFSYHGIEGNVFCEDLFDPSVELVGQYDYVVSFGVVEHFENTGNCLDACSKLLKPGGILITLIPNMPGIVGWLQKYIDKSVYDVHIPLTKENLSDAHAQTGLELLNCDYFMQINLSVVNSASFSPNRFGGYLRRILSGISKTFWFLEKRGIRLPVNRFMSPYIISTAQKHS